MVSDQLTVSLFNNKTATVRRRNKVQVLFEILEHLKDKKINTLRLSRKVNVNPDILKRYLNSLYDNGIIEMIVINGKHRNLKYYTLSSRGHGIIINTSDFFKGDMIK